MGWLQKIRYFFDRRAVVLMYHRIADVAIDPWQLAVSPENFEQQLQVLHRANPVVPASELASRLSAKSVTGNPVSLTFDDGYRDNFLSAKPLLEKYNTPATLFIATGYIGKDREFWWDELEGILLKSSMLPVRFSMLFNDGLYTFELGADSKLTPDLYKKHVAWIWPEPPPTRRCELYLSIWERLKPLPEDKLKNYLKEVRQWAAQDTEYSKENMAMSGDQLQKLVNHPLVEIGIHTITHPALSSHSYEVQQKEISGSRQYLQEIFGRNIRTIAYPYGNYDENTLQIVKNLQLTAGFTTQDKPIVKSVDPCQLGRFQVKNWNGEEFEKQLHSWFKKV